MRVATVIAAFAGWLLAGGFAAQATHLRTNPSIAAHADGLRKTRAERVDTVGRAALSDVVVLSDIAAQQTQTPAPQQPRGQMPALGRPTQSGDELPLFDFNYFIGTWNFEGVVPDSPLGTGGPVNGTTTYTLVDGHFYQAETTATGPDGKYTVKERIAYQRDQKSVARQVTDSRGFSYLQVAPVGADLGGFYYMYFESEPFTVKGQTIRLKDSLRLVSPGAYRVTSTIAVDGGRFTNFGNPWWRKAGIADGQPR